MAERRRIVTSQIPTSAAGEHFIKLTFEPLQRLYGLTFSLLWKFAHFHFNFQTIHWSPWRIRVCSQDSIHRQTLQVRNKLLCMLQRDKFSTNPVFSTKPVLSLRFWVFLSLKGYVFCRMMQYSLKHLGLENLICWIVQSLGYKVTNPCRVIKVYHNHCGAHIKKGFRVNNVHSCFPRPSNLL